MESHLPAIALRALYPFAFEILIVEGASIHAAASATPDGHSIDGTVEVIEHFIRDEDPDGKVRLISKSGFWLEKDEQSQAYAHAARGNYLWQVDIDEFYQPDDMRFLVSLLARDTNLQAVSFVTREFLGWVRLLGERLVHEAWGQEYFTVCSSLVASTGLIAHRPPTVVRSPWDRSAKVRIS